MTKPLLLPFLIVFSCVSALRADDVAPSVAVGEKFYDVATSLAPSAELKIAAWQGGISRAIEMREVDSDVLKLLDARLEFFNQLENGRTNEVSPGTSLATTDRQNISIVQAEILVLSLVSEPAAPLQKGWSDRFQKIAESVEASWNPNFHSFAFQLASDRAADGGDNQAAFQYCLWAIAYADLGDRSILRRNSRIRVLNLLASMGKLSTEVAQLAAIQLITRERLSKPVQQLARETLDLDLEVELPAINLLARRTTLGGLSQALDQENETQLRDTYLLSALHALSQPGPLAISRKRVSLYNQAIEVAESKGATEAALRLRAARMVLDLRMQRFPQVLQTAKLLYGDAKAEQLPGPSLTIAISAAIAAMQVQDSDQRDGWLESVASEATSILEAGSELASPYAPRQVLVGLSKSTLTNTDDLGGSEPQVQQIASAVSTSAASHELGGQAEPSREPQTLDWPIPWKTLSAAAAGICLLALSFLRLSHMRRSRTNAVAAALPQKKTVEAAIPTPYKPESTANKSGLMPIQLGQFLRDAAQDLTARNHNATFELASDSDGDHDSVFVADLAKLNQLVRHLGRETIRAAEGDRIMVAGQLRQHTGLATKTLELSFTYHLAAHAESNQQSLAETWAENNVLASLVHILECDVSHQCEPGGHGCLLASTPLPMHLSGTTATGKTGTTELAVLVIDNDMLVLRSMAAALQALGFKCTGCVSWDAARAHLQPPSQFAVVITDIKMPKWDGFYVLNEVSKLPVASRPRVIAMSGQLDPSTTSRISNAGFAGVLNKPHTLGQLATVVRTACAG